MHRSIQMALNSEHVASPCCALSGKKLTRKPSSSGYTSLQPNLGGLCFPPCIEPSAQFGVVLGCKTLYNRCPQGWSDLSGALQLPAQMLSLLQRISLQSERAPRTSVAAQRSMRPIAFLMKQQARKEVPSHLSRTGHLCTGGC